MTNPQVIVIGAGPTGLMLAAELGLAGVRAVVVERLLQRSGQSKALGIQPRSAEVLELRGLLEPLMDQAVQLVPGGHFAGLRLDFTTWDTRHPYMIGIPQGRVEALLEERLAALGVPVLRGYEVTALAQDDDGVEATVHGPDGETRLRGRYLVGCDGGRSTVRELLGIDFSGLDGRLLSVVADITLDDPDGAVSATWSLPVMTPDRTGKGYLAPIGDGVHRFLFYGAEQQTLSRDTPISEAEVGRALHHTVGPGVELTGIHWASRFTDASRQVERYRHGRVLLAGDAAHIHSPMGGQGLNLGLQDAFNLGWKLAAEVHGWAHPGLLDTYHAERHPVAARVLANTRAQAVLLVHDEENLALRDIVSDLLGVPEANRIVAGMISGLDIRYDLPGPSHPLLGRHLPDLDLETPDGSDRVARLLRDGRALLLTSVAPAAFAEVVAPWGTRVHHVSVTAGLGADAVLVRPDGYVGWAAAVGVTGDMAALGAASRLWAGMTTSRPRNDHQPTS
ncbi:FAD-dependent monooxygenase [Micromonospora polyrhachis]|uniref:2-polyprenyl-6-methoxyphenol hydroxylase-like FAD-dependent oxidoreductase n=1 Tax=Micromonospora polyrhachis TaxID=1282883 RepID=A0A7W7WSB7_9ACTN|nr:FAD-dependent monooxygenase [Micromonospora polyrhachis]MBB4961233.1 2-polyprenyl-6-methoxyphenol hydroxylase-like FAD-dependent oxidoreductase [Micromonospora polyrhachis]